MKNNLIFSGLLTLVPAVALAGELRIVDAPAIPASTPPLQVQQHPVKTFNNTPAKLIAWKVPTLVEVGQGKAKVITSSGEGKLIDAIQKITPKDWTILAQRTVSPNTHVKWTFTKKAWTSALEQVLQDAGLQAIINWDKKTIEIKEASKINQDASSVMTITNGEDVSTLVQQWGREKGWTIEWRAPVWKSQRSFILQGYGAEAFKNLVSEAKSQGIGLKIELYHGNHAVIQAP